MRSSPELPTPKVSLGIWALSGRLVHHRAPNSLIGCHCGAKYDRRRYVLELPAKVADYGHRHDNSRNWLHISVYLRSPVMLLVLSDIPNHRACRLPAGLMTNKQPELRLVRHQQVVPTKGLNRFWYVYWRQYPTATNWLTTSHVRERMHWYA